MAVHVKFVGKSHDGVLCWFTLLRTGLVLVAKVASVASSPVQLRSAGQGQLCQLSVDCELRGLLFVTYSFCVACR